MTLQREHDGVDVRVFLMGDAVLCALPGQTTPQGYYNLERMLNAVVKKGGQVQACGACSEVRGISNISLIPGVEVSAMSQLAAWVLESERVLTF